MVPRYLDAGDISGSVEFIYFLSIHLFSFSPPISIEFRFLFHKFTELSLEKVNELLAHTHVHHWIWIPEVLFYYVDTGIA